MINIAVLGHGVVGSGVAELIDNNSEEINKRSSISLNVKRILDLRTFPELSYSDKFTTDFNDILNDEQISIVAETMGGVEPAFSFVKQCLEAKKSVVTSNKELVATKGATLHNIAKQNNVNFMYEASVGGGVPIVRPLHNCLSGNNILSISGILNGTTNFILSKMIDEGMDFDTALKLAQDLGYAERNPSADVDGHDACRKICILSSLVYKKHLYPDDILTVGITKISLDDVKYAQALGCSVKLVASARMVQHDNSPKIECFVAPRFVPNSNMLASVSQVFNAMLIDGDCTGDVMFYGKGAGKMATASAVVGDIIDCAKLDHTDFSNCWEDCTDQASILLPSEFIQNKFFVRANNTNSATIAIKREFGENVQFIDPINNNELAFITTCITEGEFTKKIEGLVLDDINVISSIRYGFSYGKN